jgi:hypothetical protein
MLFIPCSRYVSAAHVIINQQKNQHTAKLGLLACILSRHPDIDREQRTWTASQAKRKPATALYISTVYRPIIQQVARSHLLSICLFLFPIGSIS